MKTCTKCGETKPTSQFHKDASKRDGLHSRCNVCCAAHKAANRDRIAVTSAAYRAANMGKVKAADAKYRADNKEKVKAKDAKYYAANREKKAAKNAAWNAVNRDKKASMHAEWYAANSEAAKAYNAAWRAAHPEADRIHKANRDTRVRSSGGRLSAGLPAKLFKLQRGKCACGCKQPLGDDYHLDHRMPLALGGTNTDDNMQLLRKRCNLKKHAKHPIDFMQQRGFLL